MNHYFSFGHGQYSLHGKLMLNYYATVVASDAGLARELFCEHIALPLMGSPSKWAFQYNEKDFEPKYHPAGECALIDYEGTLIWDISKVPEMGPNFKPDETSGMKGISMDNPFEDELTEEEQDELWEQNEARSVDDDEDLELDDDDFGLWDHDDDDEPQGIQEQYDASPE